MDSYATILDTKRLSTGEEERDCGTSLIYSLPLENGTKVPVCKPLFLYTLGLKSDNTIMEFVKVKRSGNLVSAISPTATTKGKYKRDDKVRKEIREHIESYKPYVSHYGLKNAPHRRYLDSDLCMMDMYKNYKSKYGENAVSDETLDFPNNLLMTVILASKAHISS